MAEAADGAEAAALTSAHAPDVVVMDIRMPGTDGLAATAAICADPELSATRVLILTTFETDEYVARALRVGASGFLGKDVAPMNCSPASAPWPPATPCSPRWPPAP